MPLGLLLATFGLSVSADEPGIHPASPASLEKATLQVHSLFPSASISFAVACNRQPTYAAADSAGLTLGLERGQGPGLIVRLSPAGEARWHHEVSRSFDSPFPPEFTPGANGAVMCAYMATDWAVKYLVLSPEGVVAHDDSVRVTDEEPVREGRAFSAGGDYYYDVYQVGNEIVLRRLTPGNRRVRIPSLDNPEAAKAEELTIGFVGSDQLFVLGIHPGNRRAGLIDLRSHVALWTQLEFPATAHPACTGRFQADRARGGELIYIGEPDSVFPDCKVYGFDVDGKLVWGRKMSGDWISPRWAVCSTDRDVAALIGNLELGIIETQTGRLLDKHEIGAQEPRKSDGGTGPPLDLWWIWEASFRDDRLTLVGQVGGGGNQPILIQATVGPNGKITSLEEHKIMMRGLAPSSLSCLVMPEEGGDTWIVAGFRK